MDEEQVREERPTEWMGEATIMTADYDPRKWENDPHLTAADLKTTDETMETWQDMGVKPEEIKDPKDAKKYREWLENHPK